MTAAVATALIANNAAVAGFTWTGIGSAAFEVDVAQSPKAASGCMPRRLVIIPKRALSVGTSDFLDLIHARQGLQRLGEAGRDVIAAGQRDLHVLLTADARDQGDPAAAAAFAAQHFADMRDGRGFAQPYP